MVEISLYGNKKIDTSSKKIREKVSKAVADYVIENWDEVVVAESDYFDEQNYTTFKINL